MPVQRKVFRIEQIDMAAAPAAVAAAKPNPELPHDEIRIDHQIVNHLALHSEAYVCRGGAGQVSSIK